MIGGFLFFLKCTGGRDPDDQMSNCLLIHGTSESPNVVAVCSVNQIRSEVSTTIAGKRCVSMVHSIEQAIYELLRIRISRHICIINNNIKINYYDLIAVCNWLLRNLIYIMTTAKYLKIPAFQDRKTI